MTIIIIGFRIACAAFEWTLMRLYITLSIDLSDRKYGPLQGNRFSPILPYSWYLQCCSSEQWSMWNASAYCSTWNNGTWFRLSESGFRDRITSNATSNHAPSVPAPLAQGSSIAPPYLASGASVAPPEWFNDSCILSHWFRCSPYHCERSERGKRAERAATNRETRHPWGFRFS